MVVVFGVHYFAQGAKLVFVSNFNICVSKKLPKTSLKSDTKQISLTKVFWGDFVKRLNKHLSSRKTEFSILCQAGLMKIKV